MNPSEQEQRKRAEVEQTYLSSAVCAAMRDRRLLSARGHPDRLKMLKRNKGGKERGEDKAKEPRMSQVSVKSKEQARVKQEKDNIYVMSCFI